MISRDHHASGHGVSCELHSHDSTFHKVLHFLSHVNVWDAGTSGDASGDNGLCLYIAINSSSRMRMISDDFYVSCGTNEAHFLLTAKNDSNNYAQLEDKNSHDIISLTLHEVKVIVSNRITSIFIFGVKYMKKKLPNV